MPAEGTGNLQAIAAVASLALWISKIDNVPGDICRSLELVQPISRYTPYLVELRGEHLVALLRETPREVQRIDDAVATATAGIDEIGRLLEKHRPASFRAAAARIGWDPAELEAFSRRWAPHLQAQRDLLLGEISHLKTFALAHPVPKMATRAERAEKGRSFDNVNLLQSSIFSSCAKQTTLKSSKLTRKLL